MQAWRDDEAVAPHLAKTVKDFASKYLSAQGDIDMEADNFDDEMLDNILLLPNGKRLSLVGGGANETSGYKDESLITASVDLRQLIAA